MIWLHQRTLIWITILVLIAWAVLQGRMRALRYRRVANVLGFRYRGRTVPESLDLSGVSFWDSFDMATNVIVGTYEGLETAAFHFHANHGDVGYKQTTVAMKSAVPISGMSGLWCASGIQAERVGNWVILFRPREEIRPEKLPEFLCDCRKLLQYFEDKAHDGQPTWGKTVDR